MNEMPMLEEYFPGGNLEGGIRLANRLDWGLVVAKTDQGWTVSSGDRLILRTESRDALETFFYGMGMAYAVLPDEVFDALEAALKEI